jgi:hypothetical protein
MAVFKGRKNRVNGIYLFWVTVWKFTVGIMAYPIAIGIETSNNRGLVMQSGCNRAKLKLVNRNEASHSAGSFKICLRRRRIGMTSIRRAEEL